MKAIVIRIAALIFKAGLKIIYALLKLLPVDRKKVLFCSRQTSEVPLDFQLIQNELDGLNAGIKYINICFRIENGIADYFRFGIKLLQSMYHLATAKVCVLDSYWPVVSILNHKKDLKVIQIWHAIGKIKKSGHASLGAVSGRSVQTAKLLNMHENYDYIIAGGKAWDRFYCESFGVSEEKLLNYGLPRIDHLINTADDNREKFYAENPQLIEKKIVLYVPTFRRGMKSQCGDIVKIAQLDGYVLVIKNHPNEKIDIKESENVYFFDNWKTMDLISVSAYIITDYSAIALEAAVLNKKTYYWTYDYEEYVANNGLNIDLHKECGANVFINLDQLIDSMVNDRYDADVLRSYRERFLPVPLGKSTEQIVSLINSLMD